MPYHFGHAVSVTTQQHWTTVLWLNPQEKIIEIIIGDKDDFVVHPNGEDKVAAPVNFTTISTRAGAPDNAKTNVTILTESGNLYNVVVNDVTGHPDAHADTQVNLDATDEMHAALSQAPKFVPAAELDALKAQVQSLEEQRKQDLAAAQQKLEAANAQSEVKLDAANTQTAYAFEKAKGDPFDVTAIFDNGKFTFVRTTTREAFSIYEVHEGKPIALNEFPDGFGTIRLDRVVTDGYFQIGKKKAEFHREEK